MGGSPTTVISVPTVQTAVALVAAGLGVSVLSDEMAEHHPGVDRVPVAGGRPELPPGLVRRQDGIVTPVGERFAGLFGTDETGEWAG